MVRKIKVAYFPSGFIFLVPIPLILGFYFIYSNYFLTGLIMCSLGMVMALLAMTTFYITEFDLKRSFYKDYVSVLGLGINYKKARLNKIDRIVITSGQHQHTVRFPGGQPYLVNWREFTAFLIHDNDELELMTKKNKEQLIKEIKGIAGFFQVDIEDRTGRYSYLVDL